MFSRITDVDNDEEKNIVYLKSTPAPWKDIAGSFDLDFGIAQLPPEIAQSARKRGIGDFFNDIKDGFEDVVEDVKDVGENIKDKGEEIIDDVKDKGEEIVEDVKDGIKDIGSGELSESFDIPLNIGEEKKEQLLFEDFTK